MKKTYKIDVDCANCANLIEDAARKTSGVQSATVNFMTLKMNVEFEEGQDPRLLCRRFAKPARRWNPIARSSCKPAKRNALLSGSLQGVLSLRQINE